MQVLKSFVRQRGLKDPFPSGITLSYCYIRLLEKADKDYRFRFLDLPPEMRLIVYRELLLFDRAQEEDDDDVSDDYMFEDDIRKNCYTSILQACREVNKEASSVLYDENVIECNFSYFRDGGDKPVR